MLLRNYYGVLFIWTEGKFVIAKFNITYIALYLYVVDHYMQNLITLAVYLRFKLIVSMTGLYIILI